MRIPHGLRAALAGQGGAAPATDSNFENVSLLLHGDGTNGAQNNTFVDGSTNNFTITRNGNTTQGTFSPLSPTGWSVYFDGTANGFISTTPTTDFDLSGDFTLQAWIFPVAGSQSNASELICRGAPSTNNGWHWLYYNNKLNFQFNYAGTLGASTTTTPLNTWSHVAITRSGNTFTHYLNGVADGTFTSSATPTTNGSDVVYIGRASYDTSNRQFPGYMAQVSVIKGTALTTFNTTSPLSVSTNGQAMLACTANRFIDVNTFQLANVFTVGSGASIQAFSPFNPTAAYSASTHGGSAYFDGTGDYLSVADNAALQMGSGDFTIEFWLNFSSLTGYQTLFNKGYTSAGSLLFQTDNGNGRMRIYIGSSNVISEAGTGSTNTWIHYALVRSGTTLTLYRDGTSSGSATNSTNINNTSTLYIGSSVTTSPDYPFTGYISNLRIVKGTALYTSNFTPPTAPLTAITNTSLLLNFTNGGIIDNASKNVLETVGNAQISTSVKKFGTGSMYFDGTGDRLYTANTSALSFGTGDFTVEAWVYLLAGGTHRFVTGTTAGGSDTFLFYLFNGSELSVLDGPNVFNPSVSMPTSTWHHIAVTKSSGTTRIFLNGTVAGSTTVLTASIAPTRMTIGDGVQYSGAVNGYIDDLRITKGVARYTANFTPPTAAFPDL